MTRELVERLEGATEGSRELSDEVLEFFGWRRDTKSSANYDGTVFSGKGYRSPIGEWAANAPSPTESVDDALALVPEGWLSSPVQFKDCWRWGLTPEEGWHVYSVAATPALALCAAILRALPEKGIEQ